jgi:hypothetical protein
MSPRKQLRLGLFALLLVVAARTGAQSNVGTTTGQFLGIEPSAHHAAMGNAGSAATLGLESVYFNPAALGGLNQLGLQFSHGFWFADIGFDYVALAAPLRGWGTVFGSVMVLDSGEIDVRTVDQPLGTGERYSVTNTAISLGFGRRITSRFLTGGVVTVAEERIWNSASRFVVFSVGTTYRLNDRGLQLGSSLSNLGTRASFSGRDTAILYDANPDVNGDNSTLPGNQFMGDFPVPSIFRIGFSYPQKLSQRSELHFLLDAQHPSDNTESVNAGAEWSYQQILSLRAGYQRMFQETSELGWTLGFGVATRMQTTRARFDYGWAEHDLLGPTHHVTLILEF